jgi:hypothetical protein
VRDAQVGKLGVPAVGQRDDVVTFEVSRVERLATDLTEPAGELEAPPAIAQVLHLGVLLAVALLGLTLGLDDRRAGSAVAGARGAGATSATARGASRPGGVASAAVIARR